MIKKIYKIIKKYNKIVIARHVGADPDCLGASLALKEIIKTNFPNKEVYAVGAGASRFKYMGQLDKMNDDLYNNSLLIVLDTPDIKRIDGVDITKFEYKIKIDHHPLIEEFADLEWVDANSSSTCQMIMEFAFLQHLKITQKAAENLFVGLIADTNRFLFYYVSPKTFRLVADLMEKTGIDVFSQYDKLYMRPINEVKLQGYIANNFTVTENGLAYIKLTNKDLQDFGVDAASAGNMINNFNYIDEVLTWVIFTEDLKQNAIRVGVRSRGPIVNRLLENYGGGGHIYASGARLANFEAAETLINELDETCKSYKANQ